MAATESTIQCARGDARDADAWTLGTPDRAIAIGDKGGRAEEYQPCGHDTHVAMESFLRLPRPRRTVGCRSEEHTSELQSLMRISYAVFCLKKKNQKIYYTMHHTRLK